MAKETGLGWTKCEVDDEGGTVRDIKNDVTSGTTMLGATDQSQVTVTAARPGWLATNKIT